MIAKKLFVGGLLAALSFASHAATDYPSGYTKCAQNTGAQCSFSGTRSVAFGKSGSFVYATYTNGVACSASNFPSSPYAGSSSTWCSYAGSTSSSSSSTSSSSSSTSSSSSSSSSSGTGSSSGITGATCNSSGSQSISSTIVVNGTYDGGCKTFNPSSSMGSGDDDEDQDPAFRINGGTLKNAILGNNGVDGVHFYGGGRLENFRWTNVGEDAWTVKESGTVTITGVSGYNGSDKWGQINAASTVNVSNCIVDNMGKMFRQNGGTTFKVTMTVDRCQISNMKEGIFRSDSSSTTGRLTNSRLRNSGDLCIGSMSCTQSGNVNY